MSIPSGVYLVLPKGFTPSSQAFGIGPVPAIYPPPDVPVRVIGNPFIERWLIREAENGTYNAFAGRGNPGDYKWKLANDTDLYVTAVRAPDNFRIESAGDNLYTIGIPGKDSILTFDSENFPSLTFKPADGSDAQRFQVIPILRD